MVPKIIHYCWFGRNPLPESAQKCIESWRKFLPDYEIKEWNEDNFDVNSIQYTKDAYEAKKYAFVSDYARFWVLYNYGGLYFDTDVEVIKPLDDIIERGAFMGVEVPVSKKSSSILINPGQGLGVEAGNVVYGEMIEGFKKLSFYKEDGSFNGYTMIPMVTDILKSHGMKDVNEVQKVAGVWIYPQEYFNPLDALTGELKVTENTRTIHWYMASWLPKQNGFVKKVKQLVRRVLSKL